MIESSVIDNGKNLYSESSRKKVEVSTVRKREIVILKHKAFSPRVT